MTYQQTVQWMFRQLPMYQRQGSSAYKANLDNILKLSHYLGNPEQNFKSIHVAGTNGKGSTSHMLASILQEAGYKVGLYTSPHLKDFRERIKIDGQMIDQSFVVDFITNHKLFFQEQALSFFEMTVGMAFQFFSEKQVDIAVIEVGLGGRLDSTNIISPLVSVITNIGIDHTQFLGNTLESIAKEKAGIIKPNTPIVIGQTQKETQSVFELKAKQQHAEIYFADQYEYPDYQTDLIGNYQRHNKKTVLKTIELLNVSGFNISSQTLKKGLAKVIENTGLLGRWQVLRQQPKMICDVAHNAEGLSYIVEQLNLEKFEQLHIVFGTVKDKDLNAIFKLLPQKAVYYFCQPNISRGLDVTVLQDQAKSFNLKGNVYNSVKQAVGKALKEASEHDLIFVGGSTFVVAEII